MTYSIGSLDAGVILGRFGASAIVCRAVATYELAGMRAAKRLEESEVVRKTNVVDLEEKSVVIKSEISTIEDVTRSRLVCLVQERATPRIAGHSPTL
jgi:hypothetical protein